jgi:outer membrane protein assembly factor BamB
MRKIAIVVAVLAVTQPIWASDWTMFGGDPQRTGLARGETDLTKQSVPKLKLQWKAKLDNQSKELTALTVPVVISGVAAPGGFRDFVLVAGADDNVFTLDADTGRVLWKKKFQITEKPKQDPHWLCPNALTATPVIDRKQLVAYILASDGQLHSLNIVNGEDSRPPRQMTPPFAKTWSLNFVNQTLYTATSQGCNSVRSAIYAMGESGEESKQFLAMKTFGAGIWGRAGVAIGRDGTVYAETGDGNFDPGKGLYADAVIAVDGKSLELKDYYTPKNNRWVWKKDLDMGNMSPVVFPYKEKELIAASGKEGVIYMLDATSMGGADHMTPLYRSDLLTNDTADFAGHGFWGAMATWQDDGGNRWLYAPAWGPASANVKFQISNGDTQHGSIMAFHVTGPAAKPMLEPVWKSVDMSVPEPPVIANGVVFALSNGENVSQVDETGHIYSSDFRATHPSGHAVLYALDGATGKVLFSSSEAISSFSHFAGLSVADGRVFVVTWDNTIYAFGLEDKR